MLAKIWLKFITFRLHDVLFSSKFVKSTPLHVVFVTLFSLFGNAVKHNLSCLMYFRERSLTIEGGGPVNFGGGLCFFGRPFGVGHNFMGPRLGEGYNFRAPFIKTLGDVHKWVLCYWLKHDKRIFIESCTQSLIAQWKSSHPEQFYKHNLIYCSFKKSINSGIP